MMRAEPVQAFPRRFGPYVLMSPIGLGEMALVTLALMGTRGREKLCVIKRPHSAVLADPSARARVKRETKIARKLSHDAIARAFADGEEDGAPYLVQEFVHGWPLSRLLSSCSELQRWPSIPLACHIVREVARALAYVHSVDGAGIIHRDIAPPNIMLSFAGEVKLIDFGIAKLGGDANKSSNTIMGRYTYGAPEIFHHGAADARSDLYGLAVVLWSLLSHRSDPHPFLRDRRGPVADEQVTIEAPPAPSNFDEQVPLALDAVVLRALAYLPEDRYQTAEDLGSALEPFMPNGFKGEEELRLFFHRHTYPSEQPVTDDMMARAVALLDADEQESPLVEPAAVTDDMMGRAAALLEAPRRYPPIVDEIPSNSQCEVEDEPIGMTEVVARRRSRQPIILVGLAIVALAGAGLAGYFRAPERIRPRPPSLPPPAFYAPPPTGAAVRAVPGSPALLPKFAAPARIASGVVPRAPASQRLVPRKLVAAPRARAPAAHLAEAFRSFNDEDFPAALRLARQAAQEGVGSTAYVLIGQVLMIQGDAQGAVAAFSEAVRRAPDNAQARGFLQQAEEMR